MTLSGKGLQWIKDIERLALKPYDDQTGKQITAWCKGATIGYGHLILRREWDEFAAGISEVEATALLWRDLAPAIRVVNDIPRKLKQHEFDACVILVFNIGVPQFQLSTARKYIVVPGFKSPIYPTLEAAWKAYNKSQGKVNKGVVNRRSAEWDMYSQNIYRHW